MKGFNYLIFSYLLFLSSCATYYEINTDFNRQFESGNIKGANQVLVSKEKKLTKGKNKLLYFMNRGVVLSMLGEYEESNKYFEKAYLFNEDYQVNYLNEGVSFLTNPMFADYRGEDHEKLLILYYKALNYLKLNQYDNALIECRRLNIRLNQLSDKYKSDKKYKEDAFIHNLMGIIYDAKHDYNNAFIAYRNALDIYNKEYLTLFKLTAPTQLKEDILRTAYLTGFDDEFAYFKEQFGMPDYKYEPQQGGELVFFWNNGLGPIKSEWSINFVVVKGQGGVVNFTNDEYGFSFPFAVPVNKETGESSLGDLSAFRVAFPKYVERNEVYTNATLSVNGKSHKLQLGEDVNAIAFKTLQERMIQEFGKALLRVALKKAAEKAARNEKDGLGTAVSIFNALTEKADTRNWQTLPHSIYYKRVNLPVGSQQVTFNMRGNQTKAQEESFTYDVQKGETIFQTYSSLDYTYRRSQ